MNEEIGNEVIEEVTPTPEPEEETESITELSIESYDLGTYSALGMTSAGVLIMLGIGVGVIIKLLKRL